MADKARNSAIIDVYSRDAESRKVEEYGVVLLLNENGDIVRQFGYSKDEARLNQIKELADGPLAPIG